MPSEKVKFQLCSGRFWVGASSSTVSQAPHCWSRSSCEFESCVVLVLSLSLFTCVCLQIASLYFCGFFPVQWTMESDFSCEDTTQIPRDSPLGLILKNWQRLTGKNSLLSRLELISLSELMWPTCKLDNNNAWLELGGLNEELISNLMSHIH